MATLLDLSHINLNLQQEVQPANLATQPIQDFNGLDKAGLKASQEFLQSFAKARAVTIDIQDDANASNNALDFERDISSKLDEASNLQGTKAQEAFNALPDRIAQSRELYADKNLNARQKFLFSKKTKDMENGFLIRANSIQAQKAMQDKLKAMDQELKNKINDVALTWNTPVFEQNLQSLKDLVAEQQTIIGYSGKDDIANAQREATSKLFSTVISGDIQNKRYGSARRGLTEHATDLDGIDRIRLMNALTASMTSDAEEKRREARSKAMEMYRALKQSAREYMEDGQFILGKKANKQANALGAQLGLPPLVLGSNDVVTQRKYNNYLANQINDLKKNHGFDDNEKQQYITMLKQDKSFLDDANKLAETEYKMSHNNTLPKTDAEKKEFNFLLASKIDTLAFKRTQEASNQAYERANFNSRAVTEFYKIADSLKMSYDNTGSINDEDFIQKVCVQSEDARNLINSLNKEQYADFKDIIHPTLSGREVGNDVAFDNIMKSKDLTIQFKNMNDVNQYVAINHFSRQQANDLKVAVKQAQMTKNTKSLNDIRKYDKDIYANKIYGNDFKDLEPEQKQVVSRAVSTRNTAIVDYATEHNLNLDSTKDWLNARFYVEAHYDFTKVNAEDEQVALDQANAMREVNDNASKEEVAFADSYLKGNDDFQTRFKFYSEIEPFSFVTGYGKTTEKHTILVRQPIFDLVNKEYSLMTRSSSAYNLDVANLQEMDKDSMDKYNKGIQTEADITEFLTKYERDNGKKWQIRYTSPTYKHSHFMTQYNVSE